jgi:hypothetical protein
VSKDAGLPLWRELVEPLRIRLGLRDAVAPPDVAQAFVDRFGRAALERYLLETLGQPRRPGPTHYILARFAASVIFTTNYDRLLERAIEDAQGTAPDVIVGDGRIPFVDDARRTTVVKLHGCLSAPETIVMTRDDYRDYAERHRAMTAYYRSVLLSRTVLFVGFSLTDDNLREIHRSTRGDMRSGRIRSFVLDAVPRSSEVVAEWRGQGFEPVLFADYFEQRRFLEQFTHVPAGDPMNCQLGAREGPPRSQTDRPSALV